MQREGFSVPLLIGGATTSKVHTAVKIDPNYDHPVVHVTDASRAVGVCQSLISPENRDAFAGTVGADYVRLREAHAGRERKGRQHAIQAARANRHALAWDGYAPPRPPRLGLRTFADYDLAELARHIDWTPFFRTWELAGTYPAILDDGVVGEAARSLFDDAQAMLERIVGEGWLTARAVIGFFPASGRGDDVEVRAGDGRDRVAATFHFLRQQMVKRSGRPNHCLADYVAPRETGIADYIGGFAVTAGHRIEDRVAAFEADHDDYSAILLKALADRLAEAFAERMHERVRKEFWGYDPDEDLTNEGTDRGTLPGHPPRARLPRLPRPQREAAPAGAPAGGGEGGPSG